ncbi:MAG: MATE family efflux transporter [Clostridia bacterium]|nr:MATE family efflux transporter [Clostridia bacterium]
MKLQKPPMAPEGVKTGEKRPLFWRRFFLPRYMVPDSKKLGDDFGTKQIYKTFLLLAWPALAEQFLTGVINFVDTLMVSKVSETAVPAIGLTIQPRMIFQVVLVAIATAVTAVVARRKGQGDREGANRVLGAILPIVVGLAVTFFVVSWFFATPILEFIGAKEDTIEYATQYYRITMFGLIFLGVSLTLNGAQRGSGNTRIAMITTVTANLVNCLFNALLIHGLWIFPRLEVAGAAIATVLGQFTAMVISIASVLRKNGYLFLKASLLFKIERKVVGPVFFVMSGALFEQLFLRVGFFAFAKQVAGLGTMDFAAHQDCMTILNLSFTVGDGLAIASSALVGQSLGQKRPDRALVFGKVAQRIGLGFAVVLCALFSIFRHQIIDWFTNDPGVLEKGANIMLLIAVILLFQIQQVLFGGTLRGAGDTRYMAVVSLLTIGTLRPGLTFILMHFTSLGLYGAWLAVLTDQIIRALFAGIRFYRGKWAKIKL